MSDVRFEPHMNDADAVLWAIERDPVLRTTIGAVGLLDAGRHLERTVVTRGRGPKDRSCG
jgi:hypothetical protein